MEAFELIRDVEEKAAEHMEMSDNPREIVVGILANKVVALQYYVKYLESRVEQIYKVR